MNVPVIQRSATLGDLAEIVMGQAPPGSECNKRGDGTPFVKAGEFSDREPITREWTTKPLKLAKRGDVLVCVVGATAGKINLGIDCAIGRSVAAIRPNGPRLDTNYLHHFFQTRVDHLRAGSQGLAQGVITREMLASLQIPLPPLGEQRRIAANLDKADTLHRKRKSSLNLLEKLSKAIFFEMFGDPVRNEKSFPWKVLGEIGQLDRGVSKHRPRNDPALLGGVHPLIQTGEVANSGGYIKSYSSTYSDVGLRQSKKWPAGTLCITIAANIARTGILTFPACFPDSVVGFRHPNEGLVQYVRVWLSFLQSTLERKAPTVAQKNINLQILRNLPIALPPTDLLDQFGARLARERQLEVKFRASESSLSDLFSSLQHRAFSGQF